MFCLVRGSGGMVIRSIGSRRKREGEVEVVLDVG